MLERVRAWFNRLPPYERDLPLLIVDGRAFTPRMALNEVLRGTPLGEKLQALIESGRLGTTEREMLTLAKLRLIKVLEALPPDKPVVATLTFPPKALTARQLINEIKRETPLGKTWIQGELRQMKMLVR